MEKDREERELAGTGDPCRDMRDRNRGCQRRAADLTEREGEKDGFHAAGTDRGKWASEGIL